MIYSRGIITLKDLKSRQDDVFTSHLKPLLKTLSSGESGKPIQMSKEKIFFK